MRLPPMSPRRGVLATAVGTLAASLVVGCGLLPGGRSQPGAPDDTVDLLTAALARHTLGGIPLVDAGARAEFDALVEPLQTYPVTVTARDIEADGDRARAVLRWAWRLDELDWAYETTVDLSTEGPDAGTDDSWSVDWRPEALEPSLGEHDVIDVVRTAAPRADILGADGAPLVTARRVVRYGLDKSRLRPARVATSAARIARELDIDVEDFRRRVRASGPDAFVEGLVLRAETAYQTVGPTFAEVPGALAVDDELPLAPTREFAAALLGRVGPATAEVIAEAKGRLRDGDQVGLSGLQARYDDQLGGRPGIEVRVRPVEGCADWPRCPTSGETRTVASSKPRRGAPLRTTLDVGLQERAEQVLADADPQGAGGTGPASALVAIRPSTGEILAAANGAADDGLNAATYGRYAPGSTFKIVSALALVRGGLDPEAPVSCPATTTVDGKQFKNYDDYPVDRLGTVSFTTALANSCNTALIGERDRLGVRDIADAAAALGLGVDHDLGFPAFLGEAPPPAGATEKAADLIGQGKILASPLAMATVAASVVAGRTVVPHLLVPDEGRALPGATPAHPLTDEESQVLRSLMRAVVTDGSGGFLADLPGEVGAKTGTAEYGEPGPDGSLPTHAWMIATRGDLAVAVFVETGASGSQTAGPVLEEFLR